MVVILALICVPSALILKLSSMKPEVETSEAAAAARLKRNTVDYAYTKKLLT